MIHSRTPSALSQGRCSPYGVKWLIEKRYISAQELLEDSFTLGRTIIDSGFRPSFMVAIWRGGTPVGIVIQEMLSVLGIETDHIPIRTSLYDGIEQRSSKIRIHGLDYVIENLKPTDQLLLVDDVFDTGVTIKSVIAEIRHRAQDEVPSDIRTAVAWYKPDNNETDIVPDYFVQTTDQWLVFPHEVDGLSDEEILVHKPEAVGLIGRVRG